MHTVTVYRQHTCTTLSPSRPVACVSLRSHLWFVLWCLRPELCAGGSLTAYYLSSKHCEMGNSPFGTLFASVPFQFHVVEYSSFISEYQNLLVSTTFWRNFVDNCQWTYVLWLNRLSELEQDIHTIYHRPWRKPVAFCQELFTRHVSCHYFRKYWDQSFNLPVVTT
jgi:hypothetical protein